MSIQIRALAKSDVAEVARLHRAAFPAFFLSELGEGFLREFYRGFLSEGSVTAVARGDKGQLLGAVVGHTNPDGFFRRLLVLRWYAFAFASLSLVLRKPAVLPRLFRALTYRGQGDHGAHSGALLSSICVDPCTGGSGIGQQLIQAFTAELKNQGGTRAYLMTDAVGNDRVNDFYVRAGWSLRESYSTPEGREMHCYVWQAGPAEGGSRIE